jgi:hypothetical protein
MKEVSASLRCPRPSVGVDLSVGGIRFYSSVLGVEVGDTLHVELALQDRLVMVVGTVTRVSGFDGSAREISLAFGAVEPETEQLFAETVASAPSRPAEHEDPPAPARKIVPEEVCELDNRRAYRAATQIEVQYRTGLTVCQGTIGDIGIGGLAVSLGAESKEEIGTEVQLEFTLEGQHFDTGGEIVRHTEDGFAVRFVKLSGPERNELRRILEGLMAAAQEHQQLTPPG